MSWLRIDDDMLDHPKWVRALRDGGPEALEIWMRLCAWCSRHLTDGEVPADMVDEVARIGRSKSRARALQALIACGLCTRHAHDEHTPSTRRAHDALTIVGYLERNPSAASVRAERERRAKTQQDYRDRRRVTGHAPVTVTAALSPRDDVPSRPVPSRPDPQECEDPERARAANDTPPNPNPTRSSGVRPVPEVPGLTVVGAPAEPHPGPLGPSRRDQGDPAAGIPPGLRYRFRPDWDPSPEHRARGREYGLSDEEILQRAEDCRRKPIKHGFLDEDEHFFRELGWMKADRETRVFKTRGEREAFESPGLHRRAT
ncbi:MAG TPA: hypothetical protein VFS67_30670 [Polyangiaceae bacterium]|nr:hypothetical protein [Polyangiaceae bacterium]